MEIELAELCVFQPPPTITSVDRKEVIARIRKHAQQHGFNVATLSSNTARAILICERSRASPSRVLDDCPFRCLLPTGQRYIVEEPCHNHDPTFRSSNRLRAAPGRFLDIKQEHSFGVAHGQYMSPTYRKTLPMFLRCNLLSVGSPVRHQVTEETVDGDSGNSHLCEEPVTCSTTWFKDTL